MKLTISALAATMALAACSTLAPNGAGPGAVSSGLSTIVKLDSGFVSGLNGPVRAYKGVPYAAPPVGPLRWKAAQPVAAWEGVRPAVTYGSDCPQGRAPTPSAAEDCLTLNVWTGAPSSSARLPVLVWIHGGAYETGAGTLPVYDGGALASQGAVIVTLNYRLGALGFFSHPELSAESPDHVSGNQAVTDMIQALKWVQANIAVFGGDPANVTIAGESAGGTSMGLLLLSPRARGLFAKAVAQSPWGFLQPTGHLTQTWYGRKPAEQAGAALGPLAELRARPLAEAMALPRAGAGATGHQVVDGVLLPDDPTTLLREGRLNPANLIVGTNRDEGTLFARPVATMKEAEARAVAAVGPGAEALPGVYGATSDAAANNANLAISRDSLFTLGARALARAADKGSEAWQYEFNRESGAGKRSGLGVFHGAEMPYFFRNLPATPYVAARVGPLKPTDFTAADEALSATMSGYLLNFMRTGDPNGPGLPAWPRFAASGAGGEAYLEFNADGAVARTDLRKPQLDAMEKLFLDQYAHR